MFFSVPQSLNELKVLQEQWKETIDLIWGKGKGEEEGEGEGKEESVKGLSQQESWHPSLWEAEAGWSGVWSQPELHGESPSQKQQELGR